MLSYMSSMGKKTKRKLSIAYFPFENESNRYTDNFKRILSRFGDIAEAPPLKNMLQRFRFRRFDVLILNWSDNSFINGKTGRISLLGVAKEFFRVAVYRVIARKLIFVRHNVYPHHAQGANKQRAKRLVELYEKCFDLCWVHSGHMVEGRRVYVPHPLYEVTRVAAGADVPVVGWSLPEKYFIVFGRIQSYKKIDQLMAVLPDDMNLVVCGTCPDQDYRQKLVALNKPNVTIIAEFIPDELAQQMILGSSGLVICHADDDMIISGSIVFSISLGVPVLSIEMPFVRWFHDTINARMIVAADSFSDLVSKMQLHQSGITVTDIAASQAHFSDQAVISHVASAFDRLHLAWRRQVRG